MAIDPDVEQLLNDLRGQVAGLSAALNNATNRIRDLEDGLQDHIGLAWGSSLVDFNAPHPNISVDTIESGGGLIRQDQHGMQVQAANDTQAFYFVEALVPDPSEEVPSGKLAGLASHSTDRGQIYLSSDSSGGATARAFTQGFGGEAQAYLSAEKSGAFNDLARVLVFQDATESYVQIIPYVRLTGINTPAQITANQNDYDPSDMGITSVLRLSSDISRDITGIVPNLNGDGRLLILANVGTSSIVLKDESASSTASNRFALKADITLSADGGALLWYDGTSSRWRCIAAY